MRLVLGFARHMRERIELGQSLLEGRVFVCYKLSCLVVFIGYNTWSGVLVIVQSLNYVFFRRF